MADPIVPAPAPAAAPAAAATAPVTQPGGAAPAAAPAPAPAKAPLSSKWKATVNAQAKLLELQGKTKDLEGKAGRLETILAKAKGDPLAVLEELGMDWGQLAQAKARAVQGLGQPAAAATPTAPAPEVKALQTQVEDVTKRLSEAEKARVAQDTQARQQAWGAFVTSVDTAIAADAKSYPAIVATKNSGLVVKEIETQYAKDRTLLTAAEAAKRVEERIRGQLQSLAKESPELVTLILGGQAPAAATGGKPDPSAVKVRSRPSSLAAAPAVTPTVVDVTPKARRDDPQVAGKGGRFVAWARKGNRIAGN